MSKSPEPPAFSLGALYICNGGIQIVNVYGAGGPQHPFRFELRFDDHSATTTNGDPHGDHWCVQGANGAGTIVRFQVSYNNDLNTGTTIYARVYDGLTADVNEAYIDGDPRYVLGDSDSSGRIWTWDHKVSGVTFSTGGTPHHVRIFKVYDHQGDRDDSLSFLAVPCTGSGSSSGGPPQSPPAFAACKVLEFLIADGKLNGSYRLHHVGQMVWRILTGPLKGCVDFSAYGDLLTVRTPFGERSFSVPHERPYALVLPGDLFGSNHDVVVTAP